MASIPESILKTKKLLSLLLFLGLGVVLVGVYSYSKSGTFFNVTPQASSVCHSSGGDDCDASTGIGGNCPRAGCHCQAIGTPRPGYSYIPGVCAPNPVKEAPKATPKPESGCGAANKGACSSGTCKTGYSCKKNGTSCGCFKISKTTPR